MKTPLAHQRQVYDLARNGNLPGTVLLWWAMGSGKTLGSLLCTAAVTKHCCVLVLCEKSIVGQWQQAIESFVKSQQCTCKNIAVKHYQTLTTEDVRPQTFDMCIVDECHIFRNAFSNEAKAPTELPYWISQIGMCPRLVYLTGTPIVSDPEREMNALHRMMRVSKDNPLKDRIFYYAPMEHAAQARNYAETRQEVVRCPMTYAQYILYAANKRSRFELEVAGDTYEVMRPVRNTYNTALISASNNPFPHTPHHSPKFMAMVARMKTSYDGGLCQMVYSQRLDSGIHALRSLYSELHPECKGNTYFIDGKMSCSDRFDTVRRFNRGSHVSRILFISDAASQGIDLRSVDVVHLLEPGCRIQEERQVINRAVRFRSHKIRGTVVQIFLYCAVFEPRAEDGPLADAVRSLGMFPEDMDEEFMDEIRGALSLHMQCEKQSVDEKIMASRLVIEESVQRALANLRKSEYTPPCQVQYFTRAAVMAVLRKALADAAGADGISMLHNVEAKVMKMRAQPNTQKRKNQTKKEKGRKRKAVK